MPGLLQDKPMLEADNPKLAGLREKGRVAFCLPTAKTEAWKYTKLRALNADDFVMPIIETTEEDHCTCGCHGDCHHEDCCCTHNLLPFEAWQFHFYNGVFKPHYPDLPRGVEVMTLLEAFEQREEVRPRVGRLALIEEYPFAALNTAYLEEGLFIGIDRGVKLEQPLLLHYHTVPGDGNLFYNIRNLVVLESDAAAEIIEIHDYDGDPKSRYFANLVNEIFIGRNAKLLHYKYQNEAFKAAHIALSAVNIKASGYYENFCWQQGADLSRNEVVVHLLEIGARAQVDAAYKMAGWATLDTTTDIQHLAAETFSNQLVKGVVDGDSRGVFQGRIRIARDAQQTEGHQLHRALLLSDQAEIDVKPELEIFADDVKCSHGAASGELDEEQLFYMQSRGISIEEARRMLVEAFLDDVLLRISDPAMREWLKSQSGSQQQ